MRRKKDRSNGITALYERLSRDDDNAVTITCEVIVTAQSLIKGGDFTVA